MRCFRLVLYFAVTAASAQTPPVSSEYANLTDQIFFHYTPEQEKSFKFPSIGTTERISGQLHEMVNSAIQSALISPNPSSGSVQQAIRDLQGQFALNVPYGSAPFLSNVPFADLSFLRGTPVCFTAFAVLRGGGGIPEILAYLQFYTNVGGVWKLQSELGSDFNGTIFSVFRVDSGMPGQVRYVVSGQTVGDPDGAGRVSVYSFDGATVRTIWSKDELFSPLHHLTDSPTPGGGKILVPPKRQTDIMRSTPGGVILESSSAVEE
jgi:hypothetical protein